MMRLLMCCLLVLPAVAQMDSAALRARYGSPLHRETFREPRGFDIVVDYGASDRVCKLEAPALMPTKEDVIRGDEQRQQMYDFLLELVPNSMRGKELRRFLSTAGMVSVTSVEYEHVTIVELRPSDVITVKFKNDECRGL